MTIILTPEIEHTLAEQARKQGTTPESLVLKAVQEKYSLPAVSSERSSKLEPRDEWERTILSMGVACGISLPNEAFSSDNFYY